MIRHYDSLDFGYVCERHRIYTPQVIDAIAQSAIEGKSRAQKLHAQILEKYVDKKGHHIEQTGDLKVDANITGELKINITRGIIRSREDLEMLTAMGNAISKQPEKPAGTVSPTELGEGIAEMIKKDTPIIVSGIDTMVFFK